VAQRGDVPLVVAQRIRWVTLHTPVPPPDAKQPPNEVVDRGGLLLLCAVGLPLEGYVPSPCPRRGRSIRRNASPMKNHPIGLGPAGRSEAPS